jgi:hypothetical protein
VAAGEEAVRRAVDRAELRRRDAGFDAEDRLLLELRFAVVEGLAVVDRLAAVERLLEAELLLAAVRRAPEPRELAGFDAALEPDAAVERAPPLAFRVLLPRDFDAARFGALPLRDDPVVRFDEFDFGCGIWLAPLRCYGRREATGDASHASEAGFGDCARYPCAKWWKTSTSRVRSRAESAGRMPDAGKTRM